MPSPRRFPLADVLALWTRLSSGAHTAFRWPVARGVAAMTTCSAHAQISAGKPAEVSVNGVSIARDAIVREMQHHAAPKPIAAWQQAARALVIRELLLQEAHRLGVVPQSISDSEGRRETDEVRCSDL